MVKIESMYAEIKCLLCGWIGKVSECPAAERISQDEDEPITHVCPECGAELVMESVLGIYSSRENTKVLDSGRIEY